jgi:hypothetical protein
MSYHILPQSGIYWRTTIETARTLNLCVALGSTHRTPGLQGLGSRATRGSVDPTESKSGRGLRPRILRRPLEWGAPATDAADCAYQRGKSRLEKIRRPPLQRDISALDPVIHSPLTVFAAWEIGDEAARG